MFSLKEFVILWILVEITHTNDFITELHLCTDKVKRAFLYLLLKGLEASKYKNTLDCAVQIWKHEGPKAYVFLQFSEGKITPELA